MKKKKKDEKKKKKRNYKFKGLQCASERARTSSHALSVASKNLPAAAPHPGPGIPSCVLLAAFRPSQENDDLLLLEHKMILLLHREGG